MKNKDTGIKINGIYIGDLKIKIEKMCEDALYTIRDYKNQPIEDVKEAKRKRVFSIVKSRVDQEYGVIHGKIRQEAYKIANLYLNL
jgi:hypothetical protein